MTALLAVTIVLTPTATAGAVPGVDDILARELLSFDVPKRLESPEKIVVRWSHYWPPALGPNCAHAVNGRCVSRTASGDPWQAWVRKGCACPAHYLGAVFVIDGRSWTCVDTGGKVIEKDGIPWVDLMTPRASYGHGTLVDALLVWPDRSGRLPERPSTPGQEGRASSLREQKIPR